MRDTTSKYRDISPTLPRFLSGSKGAILGLIAQGVANLSRTRSETVQYILTIFTALHKCRRGLAMKILFVRPSVCLSVTRVYCDKTVKKSVQIFIP